MWQVALFNLNLKKKIMKTITKQNIKEAMLKTHIRPLNDGMIDIFDYIEEGMTVEEAKAVIRREFKNNTYRNILCRVRGKRLLSSII